MAFVAIGELLAVLVLWYLMTPHGADLASAENIHRSHAVPNPRSVLTALGYLITEKGLFAELGSSFMVNVEALATATALAMVMCYNKPFAFMRPIIGTVGLWRYLGITGLTYTFMMIFSDLRTVKFVVLVFAMTPWLVTGMSQAIASIDDSEFDHARTLKLGSLDTTWQVIVRARLGDTIEIVRQNLAMSWMMVAAAEGLVQNAGGIGVVLLTAQKVGRFDEIFAALFCILTLGLLQDYFLRLVRWLVARYDFINRSS